MPATAPTREEYIASLPADRRAQILAIDALIRRTVPKLKPCAACNSLGYGPYEYRYASGRTGQSAVVALASQKNYLSIYICAVDDKGYLAGQYQSRLPKADIGKSCVRFKRLEDLDLSVLKELLKHAARVGGMAAVK